MKKIALLSIALIGLSASVLFNSCSKDSTNPKPNIELKKPSGDTTVVAGVGVNAEVYCSSDVNLKTLSLTQSVDGAAAAAIDISGSGSDGTNDLSLSDNTKTFSTILSSSTNVGTKFTYVFTVTDKNGESNSVSVTITSKAAAGDINTYTAKLLGAQGNSTEGSFFASSTGTVYTQTNAKANSSLVDFLYYYGATNNASIAAPDDSGAGTIYDNSSTGLQTWSTRNATKFASTSMTTAQFDAVSDDAAIVSAASSASATAMTSLAADKVFAFKTAQNKSGLVKVGTINGTTNGDITITVKVQK